MKKFIIAAVIIAVASIVLIASLLMADNSVKDDLLMIQNSNTDGDSSVSSKLSTIQLPDNPNVNVVFNQDTLQDVYLAGGCFWGLEAYMSRIYGVYDVTSGYANGKSENTSYEDVLYNDSGHAETVHVQYDPLLVNLDTLMAYYLKVVDPTSLNKQGNDRGSQYRTGIYYTNDNDTTTIKRVLDKEQMLYDDAIVIEVEPLEHYVLAEGYHQDYLEKNPNGYCHIDLNDVEEDLSIFVKPSDNELKVILTPLQYKVTQKEGTETAFDNEYWDNYEEGIYLDIITGQPLFSSLDKYKSGTGWPSFTKPISDSIVEEVLDKRLGFDRIEVRSILGDSHLGHVFTDGPKDKGGLRYCLNSASLKFIPREDLVEMGFSYLDYLFD